MANKEKILFHFHMFKNGGSTLDWILKKNFENAFFELHGSHSNSTLRVSDCFEITSTHTEVKAISSHHLRLPIDVDREDILPLLMLRHPIDRIASIFEHERRQPGIGRLDGKFSSLPSWLDWSIKNQPYMVCDTQVVFFADGGTYYEVPNHTAVKRAVDTLSGLPFVGVVNHYSESMLILESIVHEWNPSFNAAYFPQNVSIGRHASLSRRLESIENEIGSSLYDHLFINNSYDIELFDAACSKLLKAVKSIDGWETKLHNLNSRCEMLR